MLRARLRVSVNALKSGMLLYVRRSCISVYNTYRLAMGDDLFEDIPERKSSYSPMNDDSGKILTSNPASVAH